MQVPQNAKMARRQRELEEEEAERKRKEAAAAKLKALDEAIAAREAERCPPNSSTCSDAVLLSDTVDGLSVMLSHHNRTSCLLGVCRLALEELAAKDAAEKRAEEEAKAARAAAEAAAIAHEKAETELAALTLEEEQREAAAMPARPLSSSVSERAAIDQDQEGSVHGSSIDVQVCSPIMQPVDKQTPSHAYHSFMRVILQKCPHCPVKQCQCCA